MPRHRKERVPKNRAGQRSGNSSRPVRFRAALTRVSLGVGWLARHPAHGTRKAPAEAGSGGHGARRAAGRGPRSRRDAGSIFPRLLVTPWFAAGAGSMIAFALFITSDHASLQFASPTLRQKCTVTACGSGAGGSPGSEYGKGKSSGSAGKTDARGKPLTPADVSVTFARPWRHSSHFEVSIQITSKRPLGSWQLSFRLPGARITSVVGATWKPLKGGGGGLASAPPTQDAHGSRGKGQGAFDLFGSGTALGGQGGGAAGGGSTGGAAGGGAGGGAAGGGAGGGSAGGQGGGAAGHGGGSGGGQGGGHGWGGGWHRRHGPGGSPPGGGGKGGWNHGHHPRRGSSRDHGRGGRHHGRAPGGRRRRATTYTVEFLIFGTGNPGTPVYCVFDGRSCTFK
jgi:hypothetical protein